MDDTFDFSMLSQALMNSQEMKDAESLQSSCVNTNKISDNSSIYDKLSLNEEDIKLMRETLGNEITNNYICGHMFIKLLGK